MSKDFEDILRDFAPDIERLRNAPKRDAERIPEILSLIQDIWTTPGYEDMRFFQLLFNVFGHVSLNNMYHFEDDSTILALGDYLKERCGTGHKP
jgi:hypothetical protein